MTQFNVTGMSCAACQARVQKAVSAVDGVTECAVNLLTNSMGVEGTASSDSIISAVEAAGYGASLKNQDNQSQTQNTDSLKDTETPAMKKRLAASVLILIPLMYVSMGHMMWNWPLPSFLEGNHLAMGIYQLLLSALVMVINQKFFINGFKGLLHRSPNMDTLVALGSSASFCYSVYALFAMSSAVLAGDSQQVLYYMDQFYFEGAAMILTLITVGKMLEAKSKGKTTDALKALMNLAPQTATILEYGEEKVVPVDQLKVNSIFVVHPGDKIPADGIVVDGWSAVNESALTGESVPVEKNYEDTVYAATINTSGYMVCKAKKVGQDTSISTIIKMVGDAAATKAPVAKIADQVSGVFVPAVIAAAVVTLAVWLLVGQTFGYAVARAVSVLVISCPCALGLATPVAIMVGNGVAAKNNILFKTAAALEQTGKTQIVALDKTGTITTGVMKVTDVIPCDGVEKSRLLTAACSLEDKSEHPISKAILAIAEENSVKIEETSDFEVLPGNGLKAKINGKTVYGGNAEYIEKSASSPDSRILKQLEELSAQGKTPVLFAEENTILGIIAVADTIKDDSAQAISRLKKMGLRVVMITGDNQITAQAIAKQAGIDEVIASVKPEEKEAAIRRLMESGKTAMVGDGINDAPALTRANTGIAIGAGADIAMDAADVVLMKNSLMDVASAIIISRKTLANIRQNLFWAFFYNVLGIPLAAGCYTALLGWSLNPMFGAAAMGLSSFCVVTNALRLNMIKFNSKQEEKQNQQETKMEITVKGMMCSHCEGHVKKALEAIDGIETAVADHEKNLVTITTSKNVDESLIKAAVVDAGYEYEGVIKA